MHTSTRLRPPGSISRASALLIALVLGVPATASAGNDEGVPVGNQSAMTSAVVASVGDGSALWYNPAGIGRVTRNTADVTASVFALRIHTTDNFVQVVGGEPYAEDVIELLVIPSVLSFVRPLNDELRIGLGVFSPVSSDLVVRSDLEGRVAGVTGQLGFAFNDTRGRYVGVLGAAWTPNPRFRLGASLRAGYASNWVTAQFFVRRMEGATSDDVLTYASTSSNKLGDFGGSIGVQYDPIDALSLGLTFDTPTVGFVGFSRVSTFSALASRSPTGLELEAAIDDEGNLEANGNAYEPARFRAGVAVNLPRGRIAADVDVALPLSSSNLPLDRGLLVNGRVGGMFDVAEGLSVGMGAFTDLTPTVRDGSREGVDFVGGNVALHSENRLRLADDEEGDDIVFSSFIALRYAFGFGGIAGILLDPGNDVLVTGAEADVNVHELMLHIGSSVTF